MNWEHTTRILAIVGIGLSAFSACQSRLAAEASRDQYANSTLVQSRLQALKQYNEAFGDFDASLLLAAAATGDINVDLEEPDQLINLSLKDTKKVALAVRNVTIVFRQYEAHVNASRGIWPNAVEQHIKHAGEDAIEANNCYSKAGSPPINEGELPEKRHDLIVSCAHLAKKNSNFRLLLIILDK